MDLDSPFTDPEVERDHLVHLAFGDTFENFPFAVG